MVSQLYPWQARHLFDNWDDFDFKRFVLDKLKNTDSPLHIHVRKGLISEFYDNGQIKSRAFYIDDKVDGKYEEWYESGAIKKERYYDRGKSRKTLTEYFPNGNISFTYDMDDYGRQHGDTVAYFENGQTRWICEMEHGRHVDGVSYQSWFENGIKETELTYLNDRIVERVQWNKDGYIYYHELYNPETNSYNKNYFTRSETPDFAGSLVEDKSGARKSISGDDNIVGNGQNFLKYLKRFILIVLIIAFIWFLKEGIYLFVK